MANHKLDPEILAHLEWIGFVRPTGLVVSAPALVRAGAILDRRDAEGQLLLRSCVQERKFDSEEYPAPYLPDFHIFAEIVLGWSFSPKGYAGTAENPIQNSLEALLSDYGEILRPDFAVRELEPQGDALPWQLLVRVLEIGEDFDDIKRGSGKLEASEHGRMERLLRKTGVRAGLLFNGRVLRLISAPYGESSGWLDFRVADMIQTAGRPICTALRSLLGQTRLLALPRHQRLTALLDDSRKFQNEVSERLAEQVLHALYELLRGFQAAHDASRGELLRKPLAEHPDEVYRGLLTVLLRLVFLLYAEERDMLPEDETFLRYYSLISLYERLREDAALFPDTMDQRFGAWAQIIVLFRMIYNGAEAGDLRLPKRHGVLFDPDRFPFLEGRNADRPHSAQERLEPPLVPDGTVYRALEKLLILDGERISYRALDVEQIGSVYQTMMGFRLETATGRSIAIKAAKKFGAPSTVSLEALLGEPANKREKWLQDQADRKFPDRVKNGVKEAKTVEDLHAALLPVIDLSATPDLIPGGAMALQPSEERRRSGSHYTPRELTGPIVHTTLAPILARLRGAEGKPPRPEQILDLKACDPAMGSGAFLVETCRQLGDALVESWHFYGETPAIPADEDEVIFARRQVAQRCIYGVDRNPMAVDLAKVSLWLVTLAKDHPLTFLDHALRHGDSLVGLSRKQIEAFHWNPDAPRFNTGFETLQIQDHLNKVAELRRQIRNADEHVSDEQLRNLWNTVQAELSRVQLFGDLVVSAFIEQDNPKNRLHRLYEYANAVMSGRAEYFRPQIESYRHTDKPLVPFHWEIEFLEVFERDNPGFDVFIGNPPFAGSTMLAQAAGSGYTDWLRQQFPGTGGKCDLVAFFFRRAFELLRQLGTFGLIATNTIAQGDTRASGLMYIIHNGGTIYSATKRLQWPGQAAVVVSVVHVTRSTKAQITKTLDKKPVDQITTYLLHLGPNDEPKALVNNLGIAFLGSKPGDKGFVFGDKPGNIPLSMVQDVLRENWNREVIRPYIGGDEFNSDPVFAPHRYVIDFGGFSIEKAASYTTVFNLLQQQLQPSDHGTTWWQFARRALGLYRAIQKLPRVLAISETCNYFSFGFMPNDRVFSNSLYIFALDQWQAFTICQSHIHEAWVRTFASSFGDAQRYVGADCFDTFPFPDNWHTNLKLQILGKDYHSFRAGLMIRLNEGLTKTYNRFHDPDERDPDIFKLRELHTEMDRAVLAAYGWSDIPTDCDFFLEYEIDEEEWGDKKKPYRYRWPDEVRDEVLARLLELNAERAKAEAITGAAAKKQTKSTKKTKRKQQPTGMKDLFE